MWGILRYRNWFFEEHVRMFINIICFVDAAFISALLCDLYKDSYLFMRNCIVFMHLLRYRLNCYIKAH